MSKLKSIPAFKTEADERKFWETHDSTDYIDWSKAERVRFPNPGSRRPRRSQFACHWACWSRSRSPPTSATFRISR
jgi:hypothetical protein